MRAILITLHFLCFTGSSFVYSSDLADTTRVWELLEEGRELYEKNQLEKAILKCEEALIISKEVSFILGQAEAYLLIGQSYEQNLKLKLALQSYDNSLKAFIYLGEKEKIGILYNNKGVILKNLGDFESAEASFLQGLSVLNSINNEFYKVKLYSNLGILFRNKGDYLEAINYYNLSLNLCLKLNQKNSLGLIYGNLGNIYLDLGYFKKSINYFQNARKHFIVENNLRFAALCDENIAIAHYNLENLDSSSFYLRKSVILYKMTPNLYRLQGDIYAKDGKYMLAQSSYFSSNKIAKEVGRVSDLAETNISLARLYMLTGDTLIASKILNKGINQAKEIGDKYVLLKGIHAKYNIHKSMNNLDSALVNLENYISLKEEMSNFKTSSNIGVEESKMDFIKIQSELNELKNEHINQNQKIIFLTSFLIVLVICTLTLAIFLISFKKEIKNLRILEKNYTNQIDILKKSRPYFQENQLRYKIR